MTSPWYRATSGAYSDAIYQEQIEFYQEQIEFVRGQQHAIVTANERNFPTWTEAREWLLGRYEMEIRDLEALLVEAKNSSNRIKAMKQEGTE